MTTLTVTRPFARHASSRVSSGLSFFELVLLWASRARQRRDLAELTAEQLDDVGIARDAAAAEAAKPFWQA